MRTYLEQAIENANNQIRYATFYAANLPDLPEPYTISYGGLMTPWYIYPYDRTLISQIELLLKLYGWELGWAKTEAEVTDDNPRQLWRKKIEGRQEYPYDVEIILEFSDKLDSATCTRRKVGIVKREVPVYEYVCQEAASER